MNTNIIKHKNRGVLVFPFPSKSMYRDMNPRRLGQMASNLFC